MQRLLQGERSAPAKTVVAVAAMMQAVGSGKQAVLVAPTQVLAEQHYSSIRGMVDRMCGTGEEAAETAKSGESQTKSTHHAVVDESGQVTSGNAPEPQNGGQSDGGQVEKLLDGQSNSLPDIPVLLLLTGGMKLAARRRVLAQAASGKPCIVVATHAAFSKTLPSAQPRAGGHRRTAPFRRGTARIAERQRLHGTASAGHDGHADSAHRGHDLVRRPRHLLAHRTARRPQADPHIRRARSGTAR